MSRNIIGWLLIAPVLASSGCGHGPSGFEEQMHTTKATLAEGGDRQRLVALQSWAEYCSLNKRVNQLFELDPGATHKWFHDCEWIEIRANHCDLYLWRQGEKAGASYVRPDVTAHVYVSPPED